MVGIVKGLYLVDINLFKENDNSISNMDDFWISPLKRRTCDNSIKGWFHKGFNQFKIASFYAWLSKIKPITHYLESLKNYLFIFFLKSSSNNWNKKPYKQKKTSQMLRGFVRKNWNLIKDLKVFNQKSYEFNLNSLDPDSLPIAERTLLKSKPKALKACQRCPWMKKKPR